jgi:glycosyltransferase involved in cell wall biosynthesis
MAVKLRKPDILLVAAVRDTLPVFYHPEAANLLYDAAVFVWRRGVDAFVFNSAQGPRAKAIDPADARVSVIPNGIDGCRFAPDPDARARLRSSLGARVEETVVGVTANLTAYKGFPTLIDAAVLLRGRGESFRFVVLGADDGALGAEMRGRAEAHLPGGFNFLGRNAEVEKILPGFDFGCSASYTEGFPNALAEAMSCGVPCVATDVGESFEIVGETGWIVPPRDAEALASALSSARSTSPVERRSRGLAARSRISARYSPDKMLGAYLELYDRLVARV